MVDYLKIILFLLGCAAMTIMLGACSKMEQLGWDLKAPESATEGAEPSETGIYYTGMADMPLYKQPGDTVIKRLAKHSKVYRDALKSGYAHVRVDVTGDEGWVDNAKLIWRLPKPSASQKTAAPREEASVRPTEDSASEEIPRPVDEAEPEVPASSAPSNMPEEPAVAPSIFNPY